MNSISSTKLTKILAWVHAGLAQVLGERYQSIYLYGSQARGDARPDSDIDLLILLRGPFDYFDMVEQTSSILSELSLNNDVVLTAAFSSVEDYENSLTPFLQNVRKEGIPV